MMSMTVDITDVVEWAVEALKRSGFRGLDEGMHPEDWAAAITPAIEAVALGYAEGYKRGLHDGRHSSHVEKGHPPERPF